MCPGARSVEAELAAGHAAGIAACATGQARARAQQTIRVRAQVGIIRNVEVELGAKLRDQREAQGEEGAKLRKCAARLAAARAKLAEGEPGGARGAQTIMLEVHAALACSCCQRPEYQCFTQSWMLGSCHCHRLLLRSSSATCVGLPTGSVLTIALNNVHLSI